MNLKTELGKLLFYFERGKKAYMAYLECDSIYLYARILKDNNHAIVELLSGIHYLCPENIQQDILELTHHIDVWVSNWDYLEKELSPSLSDKFIFQNSVRYPKIAEENIVNFYKGLD